MLSVSHDETLRLWEPERNEPLAVLHEHRSLIWAAAVSPDGRTALTGGADRDLFLWDLENPALVKKLPGHADVINDIAIDASGRRAASGSNDRSVILRSLPDGILVRKLEGFNGPVSSVAFSPDGRHLLACAWNDDVTWWDLEYPEKPPLRLRGHEGGANVGRVDPTGTFAWTGGLDGTVRQWNLKTGHEWKRIPVAASRIYGLNLDAAGHRLITCGLHGHLQIRKLDRRPVPASVPASGWSSRLEFLTGLKLRDTRVIPLSPEELEDLQPRRLREVPLYRQFAAPEDGSR